jgi:hypothetical protein
MAIIDKPTDHFNTVLYTGNSNVTQTISGVGFQPDLTWIKNRDNVEYHHLADVVRGANKFIHSNATDVERTGSKSNGYNTMAFTADGFSLTNPTAQDSELNFGSRTYASWNFKAGGTAVSNTDGTITSSVSANTTSGFSIVSYTGNATSGATVGHGLGVAPKLILVKSRSNTYNWCVYAKSANSGNGQNGGFYLNLTDAWFSDSGFWNNTTASASTFTLGSGFAVNGSGATFIAYCFADVKGFSKFGSYTGNGSADGTFVYTGFKPAFVIMKRSDSADSWLMKDSVRDSYNLANKRIFANYSVAEDSSVNGSIDILSNGFKQRGSDTLTNASGGTYIYLAIAEQPFVTSTANGSIPATAR